MMRQMSSQPRQVLWICGFSAVGKKTLVEKLMAGTLRERFGILGTVEAFGDSYLPLAQIAETRAEYIVCQWQSNLDSDIEALRATLPTVPHRIVLIWRPWHEHLADWVSVYGAESINPPTELMLAQAWIDVIVPRFRDDLPEQGVPVELVDGSTPRYDRIDWEFVDRTLTIAAP